MEIERRGVAVAGNKRLQFGMLVVLAVIAGNLAARPAAISAHAVLLRSDPAQNARLTAAPARVDLFFSESLDHRFSAVHVVGTSGVRQEKSRAQFTADPTEMVLMLPALAPGFYTVSWTTVSSVDGHLLQGTFPFTLLNPDGATPSGTPPPAATGSGGATGIQPLDAGLRWLLWLGLLSIAGGFGFALIVLYPAANAVDGEQRQRAHAFARWLCSRVVGAAALIAAISNVVVLLRQAALNGSLSDAGQLLSGKTGAYWVAREALAIAAGILAWWLARREQRPAVQGALLLGLATALGGLFTMSLTSHAAAGTGTDWAVSSDFLHLAGVGLWLGSLVQLPVLLSTRRGPDGPSRTSYTGTALRRFSTLAVCAVVLVLFTGTFNALVQVPSWQAMVDTAYGRALIVKLALIVPLLGLGLWNAVRMVRRFERRALAGDEATGYRALARSAVVESLAGALVIAATAVLIFLVPAKDAVVQAAVRKASANAATVSSVYRNQAPAGDMTATLTVSPNRVGQNDFKIQLAGPGVDAVQRVQLRFQFSARQVGQSTVNADPVADQPGTYDLQAANFSLVGVWSVSVNVLRTGFDDVNGAFNVEVPDITGATTAAALTTGTRNATTFPAHGITEQQLWGAALIVAGGLLFLFRGRIWQHNRWVGIVAVVGISAAAVIGISVIATGGSQASTAAFVQNPVPADLQSVADGKALFAANCAKCHGITGHGDGPLAAGLNPKPFDLTVHVGLHPDGQLFDWITNGIPRTAMPAWKSQLSDTQRWDVLNYLRTLSPGGAAASPAAPAPAAPGAPATTPSPTASAGR
ncbi:MAG: CopD family protein [Dehalococcoidia bacterium]